LYRRGSIAARLLITSSREAGNVGIVAAKSKVGSEAGPGNPSRRDAGRLLYARPAFP
jgi:hypothetical protein